MALRLVQEFDRAGVVISRRLAQANRRFAQRLVLQGSERGGGRFLQDFLVAALNGAVTHAERPTWCRNGRR